MQSTRLPRRSGAAPPRRCAAPRLRQHFPPAPQPRTPQRGAARAMKVGDSITVERTFTTADVDDFTRVSQDRGPWHTTPDVQGRLVVHGLATIALSTVVGGAMHFMARRFGAPGRAAQRAQRTFSPR